MTNKCTLDTYSFRRDFEKIAPYPSCNREKFLAKVPGHVTVAAPGNAYYLHQPAVMFKRAAHIGTNSPYFQDLTRRDRFRLNITQNPALKYLDKSYFTAGIGNLDNFNLTFNFYTSTRTEK